MLVLGVVLSTVAALPVPAAQLAPSYVHEAQLMARDGPPGEQLGTSVAIDEDTAIVSGGDPFTAGDTPSGSALVLARQAPGVWTQQARLVPADGDLTPTFGAAVDLDGDRALVGDPEADPEGGEDAGAAYVFRRSGPGDWIQEARLTATDARPADGLGWSAALDGGTAVVGAIGDDNANGRLAGSAYSFSVDAGGNWTQTAKILASAGGPEDNFGASTALDNGTALVSNSLTAGFGAGRTYVYTQQTDGNWTEQARLLEGGGEAGPGAKHLALDGDTALVGSPGAEAFHVFTRTDAGEWIQQARVEFEDGFLMFGWSTSLEEDTALVGAASGRRPGTATNAPGSAFVYSREAPGDWSQQQRLRALDPVPNSMFGRSVALDGDGLLVGEPRDVNVNGEDGGAAWVFAPVDEAAGTGAYAGGPSSGG